MTRAEEVCVANEIVGKGEGVCVAKEGLGTVEGLCVKKGEEERLETLVEEIVCVTVPIPDILCNIEEDILIL